MHVYDDGTRIPRLENFVINSLIMEKSCMCLGFILFFIVEVFFFFFTLVNWGGGGMNRTMDV